MLPHFSARGAHRTKSSLEALEARIAPSVLIIENGGGTHFHFAQPSVDLALTKTADVATAHPGDTITYTLHPGNAGTSAVTGVTVTDPVVAGLNFVATENPGWSLNQAQTAYVFNYGPLGASAIGDEITLKLHVSPTVGADVTTLTNSATIGDDLSHGADSNPGNNTGAASVNIEADATLHIALRSESAEIAHGAKVTYTLIYSNTGDRDAHVVLTEHPHNPGSVFLTDNPGWTYNSPNGDYEFDAGTLLARSGNHSVQFVVQAPSSIPASITKLTNEATIVYAPEAAETPGNVSSDTHATLDTPIYQGIYVLSPGTSQPGHYTTPKIQVFDVSTGVKTEIQVYPTVVRDSIRTSLGDFNADGFDDILVTTEHGVGATEIFDGATGKLMASPLNGLQPFGKNKGSFVAVGDLGLFGGVSFANSLSSQLILPSSPEVVFGSALGGGAVKIYSTQSPVQTANLLAADTLAAPALQQVGATFYPFGPKFIGGVRVAIGDVNGDGRNDLVVAEGNFGGKVMVYNGGDPSNLLLSFQVGGAKYKGGLNLAVGDVDGDGVADIVTGRNRLSAPTVEVFGYQAGGTGASPASAPLKASFNAFSAAYRNGVRVALADVNHDGDLDIIATTGFAGRSQVKIFDGSLYHTNTGTITFTSTPTVTLTSSGLGEYPPGFFGTTINKLVAAAQPAVITTVPPLLKSFTAIPGNLNQAVWASGTVIVPSVPFSRVIFFPPIVS
jgi:uncharacterized repeat protein (TIGR01451 family)